MRTPALAQWLAAGLLLVAGCSSGPPAEEAQGERLSCQQGAFSLQVPEGWGGRVSRAAITVTRELPYGGGYPTLNLRRVSEAERAALDFDGSSVKRGDSEVKYRYRRWRNSRGQGYRLEALIASPRGTVFADGAVWDPARTMDRRFFDEAFWPMVNSVRVRAAD